MTWPAYLTSELQSVTDGTCYIEPRHFPEALAKHRPRGQAWRYHGKWTTYCPSRSLTYKNVRRLDPRSDEDFWTVLSEARAANMNPPTSFADFFMSCYRAPLARGSVVAPFRRFTFGGWQTVFQRGEFTGKFYLYDLNSAYRWAASCGLPHPGTAYPTKDFSKQQAIYLVELPINVIPYQRGGRLAVVTSEERDFFGLQSVTTLKVRYGVAFRSEVSLAETFEKIDKQFPASAKRISRAFWGLWNTTAAPQQVSWKHGEKIRDLRNPFFNPIWSAFVTSRVKLRMALHRTRALRIYTDSILTTEEIPTGQGIGEFKEVREFDNIWIRHAGYWGTRDETLAASGVRRPAHLTTF